MPKPIPEGYHSITPSLVFKDAKKAIAFYKKAFGAQETSSFAGPDGKIMHAELKIGDSIFMLSEAVKDPVRTLSAMLYVTDCDAVFKKAVDAGATVKRPLADMFYGDRAGDSK